MNTEDVTMKPATVAGSDRGSGLSQIARKFLSLDEARDYLKISKVTLWRWQRTGKLPVSHVGGRAWVRVSDLDVLVEAGFRSVA